MYIAQIKTVIEGVTHCDEFSVASVEDLEHAFNRQCEEFDAVHASCLDLDASFATDAFYA